jgi:hypothetical protein
MNLMFRCLDSAMYARFTLLRAKYLRARQRKKS